MANYYLDWAFDEMRRLADTFPKSITDRYFVVCTALDMDLQRYADHVVQANLRDHGREYGASQAAVVIADFDGAVHAIGGGRNYDESLMQQTAKSRRRNPARIE